MGEVAGFTEVGVRTFQAVVRQHRALATGLAHRAADIRGAAVEHRQCAAYLGALVDFVTEQVLPYASVEEDTLYATVHQADQLEGAVAGMVNEHEALASRLSRVAGAADITAAVAGAEGLATSFVSHVAKEEALVLPRLLTGTDVDVTEFVTRMDKLARRNWTALPLDVRGREPAYRQFYALSRFEALALGSTFVLIDDNDPVLVHHQLEARHDGEVGWELLQAGPPLWRARVGRLKKITSARRQDQPLGPLLVIEDTGRAPGTARVLVSVPE
ncbi:MAG: DUF2249 domain-containing protein [Acidimicrobiales bacterium]